MNKQLLKVGLIALFGWCMTFAFVSCDRDDAKTVGDKIENAADTTGDAVNRGLDKAGDAANRGINEANDAARRAAHESGEAMEQAGQKVKDWSSTTTPPTTAPSHQSNEP